jgi:hypothetical protein
MKRIFLLSPARTNGKRAEILLSEKAQFDLALRLKEGRASIGEVFSFLSGLYFRGKLSYAQRFANPPFGVRGTLVITAGRGLLSPDSPATTEILQEFSKINVSLDDIRYTKPLIKDLANLNSTLREETHVILLGSVGTNKYTELLKKYLGGKLHFPGEFKSRGDMARGALLLKAVAKESELSYESV